MEFKDYYKILGVSKNASQDEIKRAYRTLARKFHPDISKEPDAESKFKDIGEANEVLKDPEKRAAYDKFGSNWQHGQDFRPPPDWDAGFEFSGGGYTGTTDHSDFFEELFGRTRFSRGGSSPFRMQGEDQHAKIVISLAEAYLGTKKTITLQRPVVDATGHVTTKPHNLQVTIPKGILEGQRIRLEGQGMPGHGGASGGDLFLEIVFAADPIFRADKRDIHLTLPVTPWEAALGAQITVPTLGGKVQLTIPPHSQTGKKLRLKGRGLSSPTQQGDQYVTLKVIIPQPQTEDQKQLYREMAEKMPMNPRNTMGG